MTVENNVESLTKYIATKVNSLVNLPFLSESQEQRFLEIIIEEVLLLIKELAHRKDLVNK